MYDDTIAAISTPAGRGGIGIVRMSGVEAKDIAAGLVRFATAADAGWKPGRARFGYVVVDASVLDEAVLTFFAAPHSYTGEDVVEMACHGSPVVLGRLLAACVAGGARLAEPGEFTERAFRNGRLDLTAAEAVDDLISATTLHGAKLAAAQLGGALSRAVAPHKQSLVELIVELEAGIDFAEDDLDLLAPGEIASCIAAVEAPVAALAATYVYGRVVREGLTLAIVGRPNAGKSSLFNRLVGRERAIVTAQPGTTRDLIEETLEIAGIPVRLVDTAGLRTLPEGDASEPERLGIARTGEAMAGADLVLIAVEAGADEQATAALMQELHGRRFLIVRTKSDLMNASGITGLQPGALETSAKTGEGIDQLRAAIVETLHHNAGGDDSAIVTSLRQHTALLESAEALARAYLASSTQLPHELLLLDLYAALEALDRLTGATSNEDVLRLIFSRFCIGK